MLDNNSFPSPAEQHVMENSFNIRLWDRAHRQIYMGSGRKSVPRHQRGEIPCRAAPACRYNWVCSGFFERPGGLPTGAWRRCWKLVAWGELLQAQWRNKWCGATTISRQEGKGMWTKRWMERRSEIIGRGGYRWWEREGEWLHFEPVVQLLHRRESLENLDSPVRYKSGWQHSMTACLSLLPFWHKSRFPLNTLPVCLLVWVFKRPLSESWLTALWDVTETVFCSLSMVR